MLWKNVLMDSNEGLYIDLSDILNRLKALEDKGGGDYDPDPYPDPGTQTNYIAYLHNPVNIGATQKFRAWRPSYWKKITTTFEQTIDRLSYDGPYKVGRFRQFEDEYEDTDAIFDQPEAGEKYGDLLYTNNIIYKGTTVKDHGSGYLTGLYYDSTAGEMKATGFGDSPEYYYTTDHQTNTQTIDVYERVRLSSPTLYTIELPDSISYDCSKAFGKTTEYTKGILNSDDTSQSISITKGPSEASSAWYNGGLSTIVQDKVYGQLPPKKMVYLDANTIKTDIKYANFFYTGCSKYKDKYFGYVKGQTVGNDLLTRVSTSSGYVYIDGTLVTGTVYTMNKGFYALTDQSPDSQYTVALQHPWTVLRANDNIDDDSQSLFGYGRVREYDYSDTGATTTNSFVYCDHVLAYASDWAYVNPLTADYRYESHGLMEVEEYATQSITFQNDTFSHTAFPRTGIYVKKNGKMYLVCDYTSDWDLVDNVRYYYMHYYPAQDWNGIHMINASTNMMTWKGSVSDSDQISENSRYYVREASLDCECQIGGIFVGEEDTDSYENYDGYPSYIKYAKSVGSDSFHEAMNSQGLITEYTE